MMRRFSFLCAAMAAVAVLVSSLPGAMPPPGQYRNFSVSVYARVYEVRRMADPEWLQARWDAIARQVKVDKIYLETHRDTIVADEETVKRAADFFRKRGLEVAGGITLTVNESNRFETYCYSNPEHRDKVRQVVEFTAGLFDEIILDDFFFTNCKCERCIRAKGEKSWTGFRLGLMDEAARNLVIGPAKRVNPRVRMVIKYPNWYEHFQGLGFDLERGPVLFDGIYTGTETRDRTGDQHLQQYLGYSIFRYFENIRPGHNGGGWVDTYGGRYPDRYAEQIWLTLFARAPEITLFDFAQLERPIRPADRAPWQDLGPSFDFDAMAASVAAPEGGETPPLTFARAAGYALGEADRFLGRLGRPVGLASYKPYHSTGEDFLHNYLGMIGIPIDLLPRFPEDAPMVLLTESAAFDPGIVDKIKRQLTAGKSVTITSGLLRALEGKGIGEIAEIRDTGRRAIVRNFRGQPELPPGLRILIPQLQYLTNDAWELASAMTQNDLGYPLLVQAAYGGGTLYVLTIPDNFSDLYSFPPPVLTQIRNVLLGGMFVRVEAPGDVALFVYDNGTFIVESFRPEPVAVTLSLDARYTGVREVTTGETLAGKAGTSGGFGLFGAGGVKRTPVPVEINHHPTVCSPRSPDTPSSSTCRSPRSAGRWPRPCPRCPGTGANRPPVPGRSRRPSSRIWPTGCRGIR
jgi:hypothetical protein